MNKNKFLKAGFSFCIICFLVFVSIPVVNADVIRYPKEEGPYFVYLGGKILGGMGGTGDYDKHLLPFWYLTHNESISYKYEIFSIFIVNGKIQNMKNMSFPALISLRGFKGFAPTHGMYTLNLFIGRLRVIGICDEIIVYEED